MDESSESSLRTFWLCALVVGLVTAIGFGFDWLLIKEGVKRLDILLLSNLLTGAFAGLLYYQLSRIERERRAVVRQRLHTIAEMNHHIRNALQVITYATVSQDRADSVDLIRGSVERIEWSLREVLPASPENSTEHPAKPAPLSD